MTQDELILFKELIKEAVKYAVKEAVKEQMETSVKKELKEVKLLLAKSIKEGRTISVQQTPVQSPDEFKSRLREAIGGDFQPASRAPQMPRLSEEAAMQISTNGALPDIDAPIPFIKKDSVAWKEFKNRVG
jgi:hypothetical protein